MTTEYTVYLWETLTDELLIQGYDVQNLLYMRMYDINKDDGDYRQEGSYERQTYGG